MSDVNIDIVATGNSRDIEIARVRRALTDEIVVTSVADMVRKIIAFVGNDLVIGRLRIFAHAEPGVLSLYPESANSFQPMTQIAYHRGMPSNVLNGNLLRQLRGLFSADGWVELHCCSIARGEDGIGLLRGLAEILGVPVKAGKITQFSGGGIEGTTVIARPNGAVTYRH